MNAYPAYCGATAILGLALSSLPAAGAATTFKPGPGIAATVAVDGPRVSYEVRKASVAHGGTLSLETEKTVRIAVADYNADGYLDFSASHADDGMGTYSVFHIFVYQPRSDNFVALVPKCGDAFINVVIDANKRTLSNSYFVDHRMMSCSAKY